MVVSPDGSRAFVTHLVGDAITVVDLRTVPPALHGLHVLGGAYRNRIDRRSELAPCTPRRLWPTPRRFRNPERGSSCPTWSSRTAHRASTWCPVHTAVFRSRKRPRLRRWPWSVCAMNGCWAISPHEETRQARRQSFSTDDCAHRGLRSRLRGASAGEPRSTGASRGGAGRAALCGFTRHA